ncbi:adenosylcobinamide-GDP ribazoletransferase [Candidatus Mycolicibacterium alkanivorans]|uniref:Adenosylcobinamide-GDP ribazoletransferase n=1 Tax=Candidatus Mycolicibacterium alkanivorans TaxID=2954114 RepID=A0ABS9YZT2_9MYCO|nr:adenosylcobinamide-GDP ribazoletransferase [Candidatus Mycolicibacterium alkanivorans]MCI4675834.1 adenosylcobinamide-GDP ribazoletransferase [Candidatus Mycolicibacterium alkanivorans]
MTPIVPTASDLRDSWRLAVGTLTVVPVAPPLRGDHNTTRTAMLIAPIAAVPLGVAVTVLAIAGHALALPALVTGLLAVGALALGSRCLHLDGRSDTEDGLTASYDRARSLQVMTGGTAGPAGAVALIVVIGLQTAAVAALAATPGGAILAGLAVIVSRSALAVCCTRGMPPARHHGLGAAYAGTVPWFGTALVRLFAPGALTAACRFAHVAWWRGTLAAAIALVVLALLLRRTHRRLGGVTGDIFGAAVELTLTALLVDLS